MTCILALDSALNACSVALLHDGVLMASRHEEMPRNQAEFLMAMAKDCLQQAGLSQQQLTAIAVTIGPGAFTGIRIAVAAARAMAMALNIPAIGVTTTDAIAYSLGPAGRTAGAVLVETKRADFYLGLFPHGNQKEGSPPTTIVAEEILAMVQAYDNFWIAGDGVTRAAKIANMPVSLTFLTAGGSQATMAAFIAAQQLKKWNPPYLPPQPLYIRPPDVSSPARDKARAALLDKSKNAIF